MVHGERQQRMRSIDAREDEKIVILDYDGHRWRIIKKSQDRVVLIQVLSTIATSALHKFIANVTRGTFLLLLSTRFQGWRFVGFLFRNTILLSAVRLEQ